ncbi:MAG: cation transporter [Holophagales bacterium]|nr:cation transporter [Holophagales bacterium]
MSRREGHDTAARAALWSILIGILVLGLKLFAAWWTDSLALFSDALESTVNVVAATVLWLALRYAARPADDKHPFGHAKAEHFSAGLEGALVVAAAIAIGWRAVERFGSAPKVPELGIGLALGVVATAINLALALYLERTGRRLRSPALLADALHVRSDVFTSLGVFAGFGLAWATGYWALDALVALAVAAHILWAGVRAMRESVGGLMDESLAREDLESIREILDGLGPPVLEYHDLRTRKAGWRTFVELHLVVEGATTVDASHRICDRVEAEIERRIPDAAVTIHVEPEAEAKGEAVAGE